MSDRQPITLIINQQDQLHPNIQVCPSHLAVPESNWTRDEFDYLIRAYAINPYEPYPNILRVSADGTEKVLGRCTEFWYNDTDHWLWARSEIFPESLAILRSHDDASGDHIKIFL